MRLKWTVCLVLLLLLLLLLDDDAFSQEISCCNLASGSCKNACEEVSIVALADAVSQRRSILQTTKKYCSASLTDFWTCYNETLKEIAIGDHWPGRMCCSLAIGENCRRKCAISSSSINLEPDCRFSDEIDFLNCLTQQEMGLRCCEKAGLQACKDACLELFQARVTPTKDGKRRLNDSCRRGDHDTDLAVLQCVKNFTRTGNDKVKSSEEQLYCCEIAPNSACKSTCEKALKSKKSNQEIADVLQHNGCGPPLFEDKFWQCFLQSGTAGQSKDPSRIGVDSAKLHCCHAAKSNQCKSLCLKTFSHNWSVHWMDFDAKCLQKTNEYFLKACLEEVEEPCEMGCKGLNFCRHFNGRSSDLFRSCNFEADKEAEIEVDLWLKTGRIQLFDLQLKISKECPTSLWKIVACSLKIKPCLAFSSSLVCRKDCTEMLAKCVVWERRELIEDICDRISPMNQSFTSCTSLDEILDFSEDFEEDFRGSISLPCRHNSCQNDELCEINRDCDHCSPYSCAKSCKLGEISNLKVANATLAKIPFPLSSSNSDPRSCMQICRCNNGRFDNCRPAALPCNAPDHLLGSSCWVAGQRVDHHGNWWLSDTCNICGCHATEVICTERRCDALPGNSIQTRCNSNDDDDLCKDPCADRPCLASEVCIPDRRTFLVPPKSSSPQFTCVNPSLDCTSWPQEPVCDQNQTQHPNICSLLQSGAQFAYFGGCLANCDSQQPVCGMNGQTFVSACAARSKRMSVRYHGECGAKNEHCAGVRCAPLPRDCEWSIPASECCPVCVEGISVLYSSKAIGSLQPAFPHSFTLEAVLAALERQIQARECFLSGYPSRNAREIVVLMEVADETKSDASRLLVKACRREMDRLASLIRGQSPRISSDLSLSPLVVATPLNYLDQLHRSCATAKNPHNYSLTGLSMLVLITTIAVNYFVK